MPIIYIMLNRTPNHRALMQYCDQLKKGEKLNRGGAKWVKFPKNKHIPPIYILRRCVTKETLLKTCKYVQLYVYL